MDGSEAEEDAKFPGNNKVVKLRAGSGSLRCVDAEFVRNSLNHGFKNSKDFLPFLNPVCNLADDDVTWIEQEFKEIKVNPKSEQEVEDALPADFVRGMQQITPHWWTELSEIYDDRLNFSADYRVLNAFGLPWFGLQHRGRGAVTNSSGSSTRFPTIRTSCSIAIGSGGTG